MNLENLGKVLEGEPRFRYAQAQKAIFGDLIETWDNASTFSKPLREKLKQECSLDITAELFVSKEGNTIKALVTLADGKKIETVLMKHKDRNTVCVSSQVGCPMGCSFCATGNMGFKRNLTRMEIVDQVILFARYLKKSQEKITNLVFMGMGEPFLNYDNVLGAIKYLHQPETLNLGARRFSISTCGVFEGIKKLAKEDLEINLAISLNAADNDLRSKIMPINRRYPLNKLMAAVRSYLEATNRKVMFEYALIKDVNDSQKDAEELAELVEGMLCVVNLIPYNQTQKFQTADKSAIDMFKKILGAHKISAIQRYKYGEEIEAACGQLATSHK